MATFKIDVDGVLRDILTNCCKIYNNKFNTKLTPNDCFDYNVKISFPEYANINIDAADEFFNKNAFNVLYQSSTFLNVSKAIKKLRDNGHKVIITTWQYNTLNKSLTLGWLAKHNIEYDDICFTKDKFLIEADYLIDDNLEFLDQQSKHDKNVKCICIKAAYNKNDRYESYDSLYDFVNSFLKI